MNKYVLFVWDSYYPKGGWNDFYGAYETYDDALFAGITAIQRNQGEHFQIVNRNTMEIIKTK